MIHRLTEMDGTDGTDKACRLGCELLICSVNLISLSTWLNGKSQYCLLLPSFSFIYITLINQSCWIVECFLMNLLRKCQNSYYTIYSNTMKPSKQFSQVGQTILKPKASNMRTSKSTKFHKISVKQRNLEGPVQVCNSRI